MPIITIDSLADPRVEPFHAVNDPGQLSRTGRFMAEGRLVVERLIARRGREPEYAIEALLLSDAACEAMTASLASIPDVPTYVCPAAQFKQLAGLNLHRGCLCVVRRPPGRSVESVVAGARRLLVLEAIGNPDNIGGIFRNAAAFGVDGVLLSPGCGDPLYRKAIRTSMAATLVVPYAGIADWPSGLQRLRLSGFTLLALTPHPLATAIGDWVTARPAAPRPGMPGAEPLALVLGAEGPGLTADVLALADLRLRIPTSDAVDSLNVTVACGIALSHLPPLPVS